MKRPASPTPSKPPRGEGACRERLSPSGEMERGLASPKRGEFYAPWSIGLRSTEERLTLHGASGYTPRSMNMTR